MSHSEDPTEPQPPTSHPFPRLLRTAMAWHDLSGEDVADDVGVTYNTLRRWVRGETIPNRATVQKLDEVLDLDDALVMAMSGYSGMLADPFEALRVYMSAADELQARGDDASTATVDMLIAAGTTQMQYPARSTLVFPDPDSFGDQIEVRLSDLYILWLRDQETSAGESG